MGWSVLTAILSVLGILGAGYTVFLGLVASTASRKGAPTSPGLRLGVLVPAHDEEDVLPALLLDLAAQRRPAAHCLVVADACTDATARIAREAGVDVLERPGPAQGKPAALAAGIDALFANVWDVLVVLDADCRIDPGFLEGITVGPAETGQTGYLLDEERGGGLLYAYASRLEDALFHHGRARLGFPAMLRGTGMALGRQALERCPWRADGLTEDRSQGLAFLRAGIPVRYLQDLTVRSGAPRTWGDAWVQRRRWVGASLVGGLAAAIASVPGGWRAMGPRSLELPLAVFADARSFWGGALLIACLVGWATGGGGPAALTLGFLGLGGIVLGFAWYGPRFARVVLEAPFGLLLGGVAALLGLLGLGPSRWRRGRGAQPFHEDRS